MLWRLINTLFRRLNTARECVCVKRKEPHSLHLMTTATRPSFFGCALALPCLRRSAFVLVVVVFGWMLWLDARIRQPNPIERVKSCNLIDDDNTLSVEWTTFSVPPMTMHRCTVRRTWYVCMLMHHNITFNSSTLYFLLINGCVQCALLKLHNTRNRILPFWLHTNHSCESIEPVCFRI